MDVRPATVADLEAIAAIYDEYVATSVATFDLVPPPSSYWADRLASADTGDHLIVAETEGTVVGYAYSSTYRPRPAYARTRETSVYLDPRARGRGVGRALYDDLLARLRDDDIHQVLAVVALPNPASEALHRACRFTRVGLLPEVGRKFDRWVDTVIYALSLTPSS